jgi:uncharacterized membrane protein YkvA (DUF1232 family)
VFAALVAGYVFSLTDPIPDFIPGVGPLDEMVVAPIGGCLAFTVIFSVLMTLAYLLGLLD